MNAKPNVIVIVSDTLRTAQVGCYGNPDINTPNLDRFAETATRFTRAYPESLPTIPVRRALHTGRRAYPFRDYRPVKWDIVYLPGWQAIDNNEDTLAENLAAAGYQTGFVTDTLPYFAPGFNFTRGFWQWEYIRGQQQDRWRSPFTVPDELLARYGDPAQFKQNMRQLVPMHLANTAHVHSEEDTSTARTFQWATDFLEDNRSGQPFYLMVDCFDPHEPWEAPEKYYRMYASHGYKGRRIVNCGYAPVEQLGYKPEEVADIKAHYCGLVTLVDAWFGRLMQKLDDLGLADNTAVLFISDHGTNFCENPRHVIGKPDYSMYPGLMHLPFLARIPGGKAGTCDELVYNLDLTATVYDLAGIDSSDGLHGRTLRPLLTGTGDWRRREYVTCRYADSLCCLDDKSWVITNIDGEVRDVFDMESDPACQTDIASKDNGVRFRKAWDRLVADAGGDLPDYRERARTDAIGEKVIKQKNVGLCDAVRPRERRSGRRLGHKKGVPVKTMKLTLRTRDPKSDKFITTTKTIDPKRVALVGVDAWNYHWCMTFTHRAASLAPRWNRVHECARKLGMLVLHAPTDAANQYAGFPQRERARAIRYEKVPKVRDLECRFTSPASGTPCECGPGIHCHCNYGWDGNNPNLVIGEEDLITGGLEEAYSIFVERGIELVIYTGFATNMCLFGKPEALKAMYSAGLDCAVARDVSGAFTGYKPDEGLTPDHGSDDTIADLERAGVRTVHLVDEMRKAGLWHDDWLTEHVHLAPWGRESRPHLFTDSVVVTLTAPWLENVAIRYTLDGSEPHPDSPLYTEPMRLTETMTLRTTAFRDGKPASLPSDGRFVRLGPVPPKPDVPIDGVERMQELYERCAADALWLPKKSQSYEGRPLRIRGKTYASGLGMRAPANARFDLKPEYGRFVALAGADDNLVDAQMGRNLAMHANVIFRVFIDGELAAESPVMRISQEPWRFDVKIPEGSRQINLACMSAGAHHLVKLGNWVEAGFILRK